MVLWFCCASWYVFWGANLKYFFVGDSCGGLGYYIATTVWWSCFMLLMFWWCCVRVLFFVVCSACDIVFIKFCYCDFLGTTLRFPRVTRLAVHSLPCVSKIEIFMKWSVERYVRQCCERMSNMRSIVFRHISSGLSNRSGSFGPVVFFYISNTFRWCHRSIKWNKWIAGDVVMVDQRFAMKRLFSKWFVEPVLLARPSNTLPDRGVEAEKNVNRIFGHFGDVLASCSKSWQSISISARHFGLWYVWIGGSALVPQKKPWKKIRVDQGRVRECKNCMLQKSWQSKIFVGDAVCEYFRIFFAPCRGPLAARERPLMVRIWLVETVLLVRPSNTLPGRGVEADKKF